MARVFVTNFAGHDYEKAKQFGEIYWITKGYVSFQSLDRVKFLITEQIVKSDKDDWLLLSGTPLICCICAIVWFALHKKVKLLVFDQKGDGQYRQLIISEGSVIDLLKVMPDSIHEEAVNG